MTEERPSDAEITAIVAELEAAGLLTHRRRCRGPRDTGANADGQ
ncbi:MAG: hypothetical protein R6W93_08660 [Candidatus Limnocylindrales bacterium]